MGVTRTIDYKGIPTMQAVGAFDTFSNFFKEEKFEIVIEIGTAFGGLSTFLYEQSLIYKFKFITYDKFSDRLLEKIPNPEFEFRNKNCFDELVKNEIIEILSNKKCLLLCDGGNKKEEFNIFCKYLDSNSYIMAHDYSPDEKYFLENIRGKIWNWFEIKDDDVKDSLEEYVTKSKYYNIFLNVVWLSCVKK
jgi:cephalosporin hydroxylase